MSLAAAAGSCMLLAVTAGSSSAVFSWLSNPLPR